MKRDELAKSVFEAAYLTGNFKLRSGKVSTEYFDKYRFESQPMLLKEIARQLSAMVPKDTEILAGLEMGGIPIATALAFETGLPVCFVRKTAKDYGTCKFAEGISVKDKKVCVIEDVVTTGGQVVLSTNDLREDGAIINQVMCVIDRSEGDYSKLNEIDVELLALFTMAELKKAGGKA